jgi:hypothetical protein
MKKITNIFSNDDETLKLIINIEYNDKELNSPIIANITVTKDKPSIISTLYNGSNLSDAIDIFNKNL